jgi:hypothetical protein
MTEGGSTAASCLVPLMVTDMERRTPADSADSLRHGRSAGSVRKLHARDSLVERGVVGLPRLESDHHDHDHARRTVVSFCGGEFRLLRSLVWP